MKCYEPFAKVFNEQEVTSSSMVLSLHHVLVNPLSLSIERALM